MVDVSSPPTHSAAIRYAADGFSTAGTRLMGRQAAGLGFLRAAIAAAGEAPLTGYGPSSRSAEDFAAQVRDIDPAARTQWIMSHDFDALGRNGVCYLPDPVLGAEARLRLRAGPSRYSLCGVTHTTASAGAMDALANLLSAPLMPWDAIICTSEAVAKTVGILHKAEVEYVQWRFGGLGPATPPQLPVIPLGIHWDDFASTEQQKAEARRSLNISADEVVALYVGRLAIAGKAHPAPMLKGLQEAASATGSRVVLIQCGWTANDANTEAFQQGGEWLAPDIRKITLDGRHDEARRTSWAAGDLFISLSDNIQETFGLTPLEAMAAGLPVVVTDWNGYRDTVRDGVDGFRIRTWAPPPGHGGVLAVRAESGVADYGRYLWGAASATSVDQSALVTRLRELITSRDLRRSMGAAGRAHARSFDWSKVYGSYQELWADLSARRVAAAEDPEMQALLARAPRASASAPDPFFAFAHYPTSNAGPETRVCLQSAAPLEDFQAAVEHPLFSIGPMANDIAACVIARLSTGPATISELASVDRIGLRVATYAACTLAKMGIVRLDDAR